jgi:uncharacterized membrane protein
VERVERSVEVECPIRAVYHQWAQFEELPRFMSGVKEVKQLDDTHVHWHAELWGKDNEWDAEITEQLPDRRISWRSTTGDDNAGAVRFEPLPGNRTPVRLAISYQPRGTIESAGALGLFISHVEHTMKDFKRYIEQQRRDDSPRRGRP